MAKVSPLPISTVVSARRTVSEGTIVLEPEVFQHIPPETPFDFSKDLFPALLEKDAPIYGYVADGYWCDVGTIEAYQRAHRDALDRRVDVQIDGFEIADGVWMGEGAIIDPDAKIEGPVVLGEHAKVEALAKRKGVTVDGAKFADAWRAGYAPSMNRVRTGEPVGTYTMPRSSSSVIPAQLLAAPEYFQASFGQVS